jgi:PAS domain S-box-containing protein
MFIATYLWILNHHMKTNIRFEKELALLVALKSEDYILQNDRVALYGFYQSIIDNNPYVEYIFVQKQDGVLVHTFDKGVPKGLLRLPPIKTFYDAVITPITDNQGNLIYHLRIGIREPDHTLLHFGIVYNKIHRELDALKNMMMIIGAVLLATVPLGLALFFSRMVSRPLSVLRDGVGRIGSGELGVRINMPTSDGIGRLVNDFNIMSENVEKLRAGLETEIRERKQAEQELVVQTELLDNILNHVPHQIFWKDRQFVYQGCNKAFATAVGLEKTEDIVGQSDYDLPWRRKEADAFRRCDAQVVSSGNAIFDLEETATLADGEEKVVVTSKVPLKDREGRVFGLLGIFYDITERKHMDENIRQTQKMEAIGTLAGGIAHDFNNILGSILGYTELSLDEIDRETRTGEYLQQILTSALRAKELVRQILTFSRKGREERKPIRLSAVVEEETRLLRSTLPTTIEIRQRIDDGAGMVNADTTQMHQVVMNLSTNAAHAMKENGGVLEISLESVTMTPESAKKYSNIVPGPFMALKVSDTGTGIDKAIVHRIFEPFFTTKTKGKGTGMGLAVTHGIVRDHGGDIVVESEMGQGTTFTVLLPRVIHGIHETRIAEPEPPLGHERILLVDDEKTLLNIGEKILTSLGYDVTTKNGSLEALETIRQAPDFFDVIISDQTMPHMTGFVLATEILRLNPSSRCILCTGYSDTLTTEKVEGAGIKALLYKPVSKIELARTIRKVLD